jgi:hypothetical protein
MGSQDLTPYVHPHLIVEHDPLKGRFVTTSGLIRDGETLMIDAPYALVPAMLTDNPPFRLCSRHECNRRIQPLEDHVACAEGCIAEVVWCDEKCRSLDDRRHRFECCWLKQFSTEIRAEYGDSDFGLIWLVARIIILRYLQHDIHMPAVTSPVKLNGITVSHFQKRGWDAMWNLQELDVTFIPDQYGLWKAYAKKYLTAASLGFDMATGEVATLFGKVDNNSFGLYPGTTGEYPVVSFVSRGEYYGGGVYPTAAMFNHSCCPNVSRFAVNCATVTDSTPFRRSSTNSIHETRR